MSSERFSVTVTVGASTSTVEGVAHSDPDKSWIVLSDTDIQKKVDKAFQSARKAVFDARKPVGS